MKLNLCVLALTVFALQGCGSSSKKGDVESVNSDLAGKANGVSAADGASEGDQGTEGVDDSAKKTDPTVVNKAPSSELYKKFNAARISGQAKAAQEAAGELLARNPGDPLVLNSLSSLYIEREKYELARLVINKVLEKNPNNSTALNNLGVLELKENNLRLALVNFKKATEADPNNKSAHANLGAIYLQYRNYANASTELRAAVDRGDQNISTLNDLGFALAQTGRYDEAAQAYEKALSKESGNTTVMLNYAVLLIRHTDQREKGLKLLNKVRFVAHEPGILEKVEALAKMAETPKKNAQVKGVQEKETPSE